MITPLTLRFRIAFLALVVLACMFISGPAIARQGFLLVGTWENTIRSGPAPGVAMVTFNADGTFHSHRTYPKANLYVKWWGTYRATGASSWVSRIQVVQDCRGLACLSCPPGPGGDCCAAARAAGMPPGVPLKRSVQMQGPTQFVDQLGQSWQRVR